MFFVSDKLYFKLFTLLFSITVFFCFDAQAQKKKNSATQKKTNQAASKTPTKQEKAAPAERAKQAQIAEQKKRAEQAQKQKILLEQSRRRDQALREQRAKKLSFERNLRTVTVENISNDKTEGEDLEVRRAAIKALGNRAGTVVVLEVKTGKVLAIINQDWAIRESFKPCSTIKLVTAIAGLNENLITDGGNIRTASFAMNLDDALAHSNNAYFQKVGANLGSQKMIFYAQLLGLGQPTGINAENEAGGKLPLGNNNLRIYSHGDDFEVTPLQLAVLVSAISNGGQMIIPRIPRNEFEKTNFQGFLRSVISMPPENLRGVIPGMVGAASYGTASRGVASTDNVAGKTGSCIGGGSWVGLFASVAPIQNPKFAVVVITRGQGERGKFAAAIAGQIYQTLRPRFEQKSDKNLARIPTELKPQTKTDAQTSQKLDDAKDEDSDDGATTVRKGKKAGAENVAATTNGKTNVKSIELFPPVVIQVKRSNETQITRPRIVKRQ